MVNEKFELEKPLDPELQNELVKGTFIFGI